MKTIDFTERRIIVIDDNESIHADFRKTLVQEKAGTTEQNDLEAQLFGTATEPQSTNVPLFEVDSALQGQEGAEKIQRALRERRPYALAFVDMRMPPGWDGVETVRRILQTDADIQIVVCTAYADYSWDQMHAQFGNTDRVLILKKPFDLIEVTQMATALTEKWLQKHKAQRKVSDLESMIQSRTRELREQAQMDRLTGLKNRTYALDQLQQVLGSGDGVAPPFALLLIDCDQFRHINNTLGLQAGDAVLMSVSNRIAAVVRNWVDAGNGGGRACCARLAADEFVVLLDYISSTRDAEQVAADLLAGLRPPHEVNRRNVPCSASIGIAAGMADYAQAEDVLRDADVAMREAKKAGGSRSVIFEPSMRVQASMEPRLSQVV